MKRYVLLVVFIALQLILVAQIVPKPWSLEACINHAIKNNIQVQQLSLQNEQTEIRLQQAQLQRLPNLNTASNLSFNDGRTIDPFTNSFENRQIRSANTQINTGINVFNGFQITNTIKQERFNFLAGTQDLEVTRNNIALAVANQYLQILFAEELVKIASLQVEQSNQQISRTEKLVNGGVLSEDNLLNLRAQLANDKLSLINNQNQLINAKIQLQQQLNLDINNNFEIEKPPLVMDINGVEANFEQLFAQALERMPEIKREQFRVKAADMANRLAKGGRYPRLSAFGSMSTLWSDSRVDITGVELEGFRPNGQILNNDPTQLVYAPITRFQTMPTPFQKQLNNNFGTVFGLSLNIPIFNNGQVNANVRRANLGIKQANLGLKQAQLTLYQDVARAVNDLQAAKQRYLANKENLDAQKANYQFAEKRFEQGLINPFDFTNIRARYQQAEANLLQAKYEYVFRSKIIEFYQGKSITL